MPKKHFSEGVGTWTELKLEYIRKYLNAYSNILTYAGYKEYYFIDAFAGSGICKCKKTGNFTRGSSLIALSTNPLFKRYFFIEISPENIKLLNESIDKYFSKLKLLIEIFNDDCNLKIESILNQINNQTPFIALLDPQAGDLYFETIKKIATKNKAEVLINFPFGMAINRYMLLTEGSKISSEMENQLKLIFGNDDWKSIYLERKKRTISPMLAREKYLDLYLNSLIAIGFQFYAVKNIRNSLGNHIYYLIFGTKNLRGLEKMKDEFVKNESARNSLFFLQDLKMEIYKNFNKEKNLTLNLVLNKLLPGKHLYRKQDFKQALILLAKEGKLVRINSRKKARSFNDDDFFRLL